VPRERGIIYLTNVPGCLEVGTVGTYWVGVCQRWEQWEREQPDLRYGGGFREHIVLDMPGRMNARKRYSQEPLYIAPYAVA